MHDIKSLADARVVVKDAIHIVSNMDPDGTSADHHPITNLAVHGTKTITNAAGVIKDTIDIMSNKNSVGVPLIGNTSYPVINLAIHSAKTVYNATEVMKDMKDALFAIVPGHRKQNCEQEETQSLSIIVLTVQWFFPYRIRLILRPVSYIIQWLPFYGFIQRIPVLGSVMHSILGAL